MSRCPKSLTLWQSVRNGATPCGIRLVLAVYGIFLKPISWATCLELLLAGACFLACHTCHPCHTVQYNMLLAIWQLIACAACSVIDHLTYPHNHVRSNADFINSKGDQLCCDSQITTHVTHVQACTGLNKVSNLEPGLSMSCCMHMLLQLPRTTHTSLSMSHRRPF